MKSYAKSHNSIGIHVAFILLVLVSLVSAPAFGAVYTVNPTLDYGNSDGGSDTWGYTCQIGQYQAWFGFDVSAIPDGETISSASFTGLVQNLYGTSTQRTVWFEPDDSWIPGNVNPGTKLLTELVGTGMDYYNPTWVTFNLDISKHNWGNDLSDNYVSLMLTGPQNGNHECGRVDLTESGNLPSLQITTVPEPATICLLGLGALSLIRKKRA